MENFSISHVNLFDVQSRRLCEIYIYLLISKFIFQILVVIKLFFVLYEMYFSIWFQLRRIYDFFWKITFYSILYYLFSSLSTFSFYNILKMSAHSLVIFWWFYTFYNLISPVHSISFITCINNIIPSLHLQSILKL